MAINAATYSGGIPEKVYCVMSLARSGATHLGVDEKRKGLVHFQSTVLVEETANPFSLSFQLYLERKVFCGALKQAHCMHALQNMACLFSTVNKTFGNYRLFHYYFDFPILICPSWNY